MKPKICINKTTGEIVSFGYEDLSRFDDAYDKIEVEIDKLPDKREYLKWDGRKIVVDEDKKTNLIAKEKAKKIREEKIQKEMRTIAEERLKVRGEL